MPDRDRTTNLLPSPSAPVAAFRLHNSHIYVSPIWRSPWDNFSWPKKTFCAQLRLRSQGTSHKAMPQSPIFQRDNKLRIDSCYKIYECSLSPLAAKLRQNHGTNATKSLGRTVHRSTVPLMTYPQVNSYIPQVYHMAGFCSMRAPFLVTQHFSEKRIQIIKTRREKYHSTTVILHSSM